MDRDSSKATTLHPLLHRWFVEYNPISLVSAMLVLAGMILTSRGLAREGSLYGLFGVAAIAEVYAFALIGGAALLVRIKQQRPAVMLALLTVLYQSDLTLHTEACANLGPIGGAAGIAWFVSFALKLRLLAWALEIRIEKRTLATALSGAAGLVLMPHLLARTSMTTASGALALYVFVLGSLVPSSPERAVSSRVALDDWGRTVLRRTVSATWILWAVLVALHVLFWKTQHPLLHLGAVLPALALVLVRLVKSETRTWIAVGTLLAVVFVVAPEGFSTSALLASLTLVRRAFSGGHVATSQLVTSVTQDPSPYRAPESAEAPAATVIVPSLVPIGAAERVRLLTGGLFAVYLSAWTFGWRGGALPAHVFLLDAGLVVSALLVIWRLRGRLVILPVTAACLHGLVVHDLVPLPESMIGQGVLAVALGFVLLAVSLAASYRLRDVAATPTPTARE